MLYISGSDRTDCRVSERAAVPHVAVSSAIYHICIAVEHCQALSQLTSVLRLAFTKSKVVLLPIETYKPLTSRDV
jgi:hypothetical protein